MSTISKNVTALLAAIMTFAILWTLLIETGITAQAWDWWQVNAVETAYQGQDDLRATEWWGLPALIISFMIPLFSLMITVVGAAITYDYVKTKA